MDPLTIVLAALAALSELLALSPGDRANGILHALWTVAVHVHADSECNVDVEAGKQPQ